MRRNKAGIYLLLSVVLLLSACSSGTPSSSSEPSASPAESAGPAASAAPSPSIGPASLRLAIWDVNQRPSMEQIAAEFMKQYPEVKVTVESSPFDQYWTKLQTSVAGDSAPDVFWMNVIQLLLYTRNGALLPISDLVTRDKVDLSAFPKQLVDMFTDRGQLYAMPKDIDCVGLWYNKELFDQAGVKYPDETWTWDTVVEAAKKLTNTAKGVWGIAANLHTREGYYNTIPQAGGFIISEDRKKSGYDTPETIAGLKFWTDLIHVHKVSPTLAQMTDTAPLAMFQSGKVAMYYGGSWRTRELANNEYTKSRVNVAVLPAGKKRACSANGLGFAIYAKTKNKEAAWALVKFLGSKQAMDIQAKTGTVIPARLDSQQLWVESTPQFNLKVFMDMMDYAVIQPYSLETQKWRDVETKYFKQAWAGQMSIEDAAKKVAEEMNALLAQEGT